MDWSRLGNNALTLIILFGIGYIIWKKIQGDNIDLIGGIKKIGGVGRIKK